MYECLPGRRPEDETHPAHPMQPAHPRGRAGVITCPLERAELYRERLESHGLTATIERLG
jgi:ATP-dependent Clp protease adapter protein ClpS